MRRPSPARTARWIAFASFLIYVATGGGRIVGSDEVTMLELSHAILRGGLAVPPGATLTGPDGREYTKNAAGQAVLAVPLVATGDVAARIFGVRPEQRMLAVRFMASFFDAMITALSLATFYLLARAAGIGPGAALAATGALGFTTPMWVYAKSFMAEPLQTLGLLLTLLGGVRASAGSRRWAWLSGLGVLVAVSAKVSMLPFALIALVPLAGAGRAAWIPAGLGLAAALLGHGLYAVARFGTPWETGYGAQATLAAYGTPWWVGAYGLLISSGKGVVWFAPAILLAGIGARLAPRRIAWTVALTWLLALSLYGRFQHWGGDGSFGPRYLIPFLPSAFLLVAFALEHANRARRRWAVVLAIAGLCVQIGGVGIYFGAQMREAGDYPYSLPLEHPRFMSDSHFNPRFSPIVGHWRLLARNLSEHLSGHAPSLAPDGGTPDPRLGVSPGQQQQLLHAIDFWWLYLGYAGLPRAPVVAALLAVLVLAAWACTGLRLAWREERRAHADDPSILHGGTRT